MIFKAIKTIIKRKELLVTLLCILTLSCANPTKDKDILGLKGEVKECHETRYDAQKKDGKWTKSYIQQYAFENFYMNIEGNYDSIKYKDQDNKIIMYLIPERKDGRIDVEKIFDADGQLMYSQKYQYYSDFETYYEKLTPNGLKEMEFRVSYDIYHRIKSMKYKLFTYKQKVDSSIDDKKNKALKSSQKPIDISNYDVKYTYKDGHIESIQTSLEDNISYTISYEYLEFDSYDNWIKRVEKYSDGYNKRYTYVTHEISYYQ
ncbi:hypothetical protein K5X82_04635 [Halosquirtibacter xylanolyticus]|uniref:hypothetical protein n=1 Tax=Halosquirtibacter xylanolyticus TaxID=3374599 RepID=UPI00374A1EE5|nr:hypothetical protein K5X82_04635 [Prolixibacteraceae bacterium]